MAPQRAIGLAVDTVGSYGREVIRGVMEFCHRNPHWVIAVEPNFWLYDNAPHPEDWNVDGLIAQLHNPKLIERIEDAGTPAINVSNMYGRESKIPVVVPDDLAIGEMAATYLLSLPVRHFGFCMHGGLEYARLRLEAFRNRLAAAGFDCQVCDTDNRDIGAISQWLLLQARPIAVFCCNDAFAHHLVSAARRCGLAIPEQVAVLGVDDDELLNTLGACSLSSISIPAAKVGFEAARLLEALLNGTPPPLRTNLPPVCVVPRTTTDLAFVEDPHVAQALQFIKSNVAHPIQVDDVVEHLSVSRRSLERRFYKMVGCSVGSAIRKAHIERAKQLLSATGLSIEEVAAASGFTSATLLGVVFRKHVGQSPSVFRTRSGFATPREPARQPAIH
jgi:LacI family transcriptional regulator